MEVATGRVLGTLDQSIRHAFRSEETLFVVDDENVAHEQTFGGGDSAPSRSAKTWPHCP